MSIAIFIERERERERERGAKAFARNNVIKATILGALK